MNLNLDFVRKQFPSLSGEWVFMDNAGGSQILLSVINRITEYLIYSNVQLGATYELSRIATERVNVSAPQMIAEFINAKDRSEIIIGSSTTMLIRILASQIGQTFNTGDEIIITNCDHEANAGAWAELSKIGIVVKQWEINRDNFKMELDDLKKIITDKTRLVAVTHTSNILGTLNPIKEITKFVHSYNALICVDGVAHAPHRLIDVQDTGVDFYAFSFYKLFGPHAAMLYGKKELLLNIPGMCHFFIDPSDVPYKFQPGSPNYELSYGLLGIQDYFNSMANAHNFNGKNFRENSAYCYQLISNHEEKLAQRLLDFLKSKSCIKIIGETSADKSIRVPTISFIADGKQSSSISEKVDNYKIGIRYGDFYARRLIDDLGLSKQDGVVRISLVHYNTIEEVDNLIYVLERIL